MSIWQQMSSQSGIMCQTHLRSPHTFPLSRQPMRVIVLGMRCQKLSHKFHIVLGRKLYAWRMSHDSSLSARVPEKVRYPMWCRNDDSGCGHATDRRNSRGFSWKNFKNMVQYEDMISWYSVYDITYDISPVASRVCSFLTLKEITFFRPISRKVKVSVVGDGAMQHCPFWLFPAARTELSSKKFQFIFLLIIVKNKNWLRSINTHLFSVFLLRQSKMCFLRWNLLANNCKNIYHKTFGHLTCRESIF